MLLLSMMMTSIQLLLKKPCFPPTNIGDVTTLSKVITSILRLLKKLCFPPTKIGDVTIVYDDDKHSTAPNHGIVFYKLRAQPSSEKNWIVAVAPMGALVPPT